MVQYDPQVIQRHAQRLYTRAASIAILYGLLFGLSGGLFGYLGTIIFKTSGLWQDFGFMALIYCVALPATLGAALGHMKSFDLRLQAQTALCQAQIEFNGRAPAPPAQQPAPDPGPGPAANHAAPVQPR